MKPIQFKLPPQPKDPPPLRIENFGGVDFSTTPTQIAENRSPDMLNMTLDERGKPAKRTGYDRIFTTSLGAGAINGMFEYEKKDGTTKFLIAHGTTLYTQTGTDQPVEIYSGLANAKVRFFVMADKCYIMDGTNYLVYDGATVAAVTPYIPTLTLGRAPAGGGTPFEDFNLLGAGFKDSFSSVTGSMTYQLSLTNLDATAVTATLNGVTKAETTDFTVNRTTGAVTLLVDPSDGTNNLIITAYKTQTGFPDRVKKCTNFVIFGGTNDTRVHIAGNPDYPNQVWRSGLYDPTYWPENAYNKVGSDAGRIMGFAKQYDNCVILKEYSPNDTMVWSMGFELTADGKATFPVKPINYNTGCKASGSILLVANNPVWLSNKGAFRLVSSILKDERNTEHISDRVDRDLLLESNLDGAVAVDFENKYWLAVNGKVYVWDYGNLLPNEIVGEWYVYDNIPANCFLAKSDGYLYFGSSAEGLVYKFKKTTGLKPYNDDGVAINAYRDSKLISMGIEEYRKMISVVHIGLNPDVRTSCDLYFRTEKNDAWTFKKTFSKYLFNYLPIHYDHFSYLTSKLPQPNTSKIKSKKTVYFQTRLKNDKLDESMGITYQIVEWHIQGKVK